MKKYKEFLSVICDIDNLSVKEIMEITGKSQPVVYSWMNLSKEDCLPSIESLMKILFRLGLSLDDFINCRHPVYDDPNDKKSPRIYYQYFCGDVTEVDPERGYILVDIRTADEKSEFPLNKILCINKSDYSTRTISIGELLVGEKMYVYKSGGWGRICVIVR